MDMTMFRRRGLLLNTPHIVSESDSIVTFDSAYNKVPIKSLICNIEPIQDLHGYDNPWPAGGGKNKVNFSNISVEADVYTLLIIGAVDLPAGTYTFSYTLSATVTATRNRPMYTINDTNYYSDDIKTAGRGSWTFTLEEQSTVLFRWWGHTVSPACTISDFQLEAGSTATSYSPYSNICPISGRTGLSVVRTGINVWDEEWESGQYNSVSNTIVKEPSNKHIRSKNPIPVKPNTTYYMNSAGENVHLIVADADENIVYRTITINNGLFTTPDKGAFVYFNMAAAYGTTYNHDISINYPSTDTGYHPYSGSTYSVNWESEAGTVYGGTLDMVSGKLTVDSACIASYNGETLPSTWISDRDVYSAGATPTIGAQVVYKLATPTEIQLTPHEVKTFLENNIWCDSGDVSVNYWKWGN